MAEHRVWFRARLTRSKLCNGGASSVLVDPDTGHGASGAHLARLTLSGHVTGIDHSDVMVRVALWRNQQLISQGHIEIMQSRSDRMSLPDASFDRVLATHVLYFWDPAEAHLREIARVLVPRGTLVLGFRLAGDEAMAARLPAPVYRLKTPTGEVKHLLLACQFRIEREERGDRPGNSMVWPVAKRDWGEHRELASLHVKSCTFRAADECRRGYRIGCVDERQNLIEVALRSVDRCEAAVVTN